VPSFWTTVVLDSNNEDYLAKIVTSIQLSGTLELEVQIRIPLDAWRNMAPIIVSQGQRIRTLRLIGRREQTPSGLPDILASFGQLPALRHLHLHEPPLLSIPSVWEPPPNGLILSRFPSLQTVTGFSLKPDDVTSLSHSKIRSICIQNFDGSLIPTLLQFPDLQHLDLHPRLSLKPWGNSGRKLSHALRLPLSSINIETNSISDFNLILMYMGQGLREIYITQLDIGSFFDSIIPLQQFQITHIKVDLTQSGREYNKDISTNCYLPSVKFLALHFDGEPEHTAQPLINAIFRTLVGVMPSVESFILRGDVSLTLSLQYIQTLSQLRSLVLHCNLDASLNSPIPFVGKLLENFDWAGNPPTQFFNQLQCPSLLNLCFCDHPTGNGTGYLEAESPIPFGIPMLTLGIPIATTSSVISLSLVTRYIIRVELASFPAVTRVCLTHAIWVGDFFEELLLRPNDCPKLEDIIVEGSYLEWDILLLMLERRNFATKSGVASIKSIQFMLELPFKLLHAISELLRGNYLVDIQIAEFSIGAVSKRMCTQSK
jgi:hypothetical protein